MGLPNGSQAATYNTEDIERFLILYDKSDCNISFAARKAGIRGGRSVVLQLRDRIEWMDERMAEIEQALFDNIESGEMSRAKKGRKSAQFMLKYHREGKKRGYGTRSEITGREGKDLMSWKDLANEAEG